MTMLSFRADEREARDAQEWAERLGVDRSELLPNALHAYLVRLAGEREASRSAGIDAPKAGARLEMSDWGPADEWSDWVDATG